MEALGMLIYSMFVWKKSRRIEAVVAKKAAGAHLCLQGSEKAEAWHLGTEVPRKNRNFQCTKAGELISMSVTVKTSASVSPLGAIH